MHIILIIIIVILSLAAAVWAIGVKSQTPKRVTTDKTPDVPYREVEIPSGHAKLKGWLIPSPSAIRDHLSPVMILVHGWGSNKSRMLRYMKPLLDAGYTLLMIDVRGHGESDDVKALTVKVFRDDIISAVQYSRRLSDIDPDRIGILAHSFGGFGSIFANTLPLGIKAVVTDSAPIRLRTIMEVSLARYKLPYYPLGPILSKLMFIRARISRKELQQQFDILNAMDEQKSFILMIHSKHDDYVPSSELAYLIDHNKIDGVQRSYLYVESKGHRSSETDRRFWLQVLPFLDQHLGRAKYFDELPTM